MPLFSGQAVHFRGLAGTTFVCLAVGLTSYVIGFVSNSWVVRTVFSGSQHEGLWQSCVCSSQSRDSDWFRAVQALITAGLVGLLVAIIVTFIYMCLPSASKKRTLIALAVICFVTVGLMIAGFVIYGTNESSLNWSFLLAVIGAVFCLLAGICAAVLSSALGVIVQAKVFGISI